MQGIRRWVDVRLETFARTARRGLARHEVIRVLGDDLGLTILDQAMPASVRATNSGVLVVVNDQLTPRGRDLAIAHEFAHVLVRRGDAGWVRRSDEERFADAFARELLAPRELLARVGLVRSAQETCDSFDVDLSTAAVQLARSGLLPALTREEGGRVLCAACGPELRSRGCECGHYRHGRAGELPQAEGAWPCGASDALSPGAAAAAVA